MVSCVEHNTTNHPFAKDKLTRANPPLSPGGRDFVDKCYNKVLSTHMNCEQMRQALRKGDTFELESGSQRRHALNLAKAMGVAVTTRKMVRGGYTVIFLDCQQQNKKAKRNGN